MELLQISLLRRLLLSLSIPDGVGYVGGSDRLPQPLEKEEERKAIEGVLAGDGEAKRRLIEHNLRLVVYIARRFDNTGVGLEDLISIGTIGLIKAMETYRSDKNIKLATYASRCIENEILMHLRKRSRERGEVSLDEPINTDWDGNELLLPDVLGTDGEEVSRGLEEDAEAELLHDALSRLGKREKDIIELRFGLGGHSEHTQKEVAERMGISQSYISRLEKRIITQLRRELSRAML